MPTPTELRIVCAPLALAALLALVAAPAAGQTVPPEIQTGPMAGFIGGSDGSGHIYYFEDVKSPPLEDSDFFTTTWALHVSIDDFDGRPDGSLYNYAGVLFDLIYDGHEASSLTVMPAGPHFGATYTLVGGGSTSQTAFPLTMWHISAQSTGVTIYPSSLISLFQVSGHATNTTTCFNNSDIDISASMWVILHAEDTITTVVPGSVWAYMLPGGTAWASQPGQGIWVHIPPNTSPLVIPHSAFGAFRTIPDGSTVVGNVAGYGIEHVPEPLSALLMLAGTGAMITGRLRRRRA